MTIAWSAQVLQTRRSFLRGALSTLAAPAIVLTPGLLMPVRALAVAPNVVAAPYSKTFFATYVTERHAWGWVDGHWQDLLTPGIDAWWAKQYEHFVAYRC